MMNKERRKAEDPNLLTWKLTAASCVMSGFAVRIPNVGESHDKNKRDTNGVYGQSDTAIGGVGGHVGVFGKTSSTSFPDAGVSGLAPSNSGGAVGVYGDASASSGGGIGVYGIGGQIGGSFIGGNYGVDGTSNLGIGVHGSSNFKSGVEGVTSVGATYASGVLGEATSATGPVVGVRGVAVNIGAAVSSQKLRPPEPRSGGPNEILLLWNDILPWLVDQLAVFSDSTLSRLLSTTASGWQNQKHALSGIDSGCGGLRSEKQDRMAKERAWKGARRAVDIGQQAIYIAATHRRSMASPAIESPLWTPCYVPPL